MKKDHYGLFKATIPVSYVQLLLEIVQERGISERELLLQSRFPANLITETDARVSPRQWSKLVMNAIILTYDEGLGCEYGMRLRLTAHGALGFALMSCATLGQALELGAAFSSMRLRDYQIRFKTDDQFSIIQISETHPIDAPPNQITILRRFFYECLLFGIAQISHYLTGKDFPLIEIDVDWPEPKYFSFYKDRLPQIHFNQKYCQIYFPASYMQLPLPMADPIAYQQVLIHCENERFRHLGEVDNLIERVKAELVLTSREGYPSLSIVAKKLFISDRSLKRHLQSLDTSFMTLLDNVRMQDAKKLLSNPDIQIQSIAEIIGYVTPANFTRAFKRWTGITPTQYRENFGNQQNSKELL